MTIAIGFCSGGSVEHEFCHSLAATLVLDAAGRREITNVIDVNGGAYIDANRDAIVRAFLEGDEDWLLMLDADMVWDPQQVYELLDSANPADRPVVGALYFSGGRAGGPIWPLIGDRSDDGLHTTWRRDYRLGLEPCDATGGGFLLIHRRVLAAVGYANSHLPGGHPNPLPWFSDDIVAGERRGEDVVFCYRARDLGIPVYVNTQVDVGHKKPMYLNAATYQQLLATHRAKEANAA